MKRHILICPNCGHRFIQPLFITGLYMAYKCNCLDDMTWLVPLTKEEIEERTKEAGE